MNKKVICYARVSTKEQGMSQLGLEAQIEDMRRFAERNNLDIVDVRKEVVSGAYELERRPVLKKAFTDASKIKDCFVLTSKIDRLSRKAVFIYSLLDKGAKFIVAECGVDCSTLEIHIRATFAEDERRKIGERTKAAFQMKKKRNEPMGMHIDRIAIHKQRAISLAAEANKKEADEFASFMKPTIFRMKNTGMSLHAIADELNLHGYKTPRGGKWYGKTVANIMARGDWQ